MTKNAALEGTAYRADLAERMLKKSINFAGAQRKAWEHHVTECRDERMVKGGINGLLQ